MQRTIPKLGNISTLMKEVENDLLRTVLVQTWTPVYLLVSLVSITQFYCSYYYFYCYCMHVIMTI